MRLKLRNFILLLLLAGLLAPGNYAFAQSKTTDRRSFDEDELKNEPRFDLELEVQALEGALDPDTYIVGPGDEFFINIWSTEEFGQRSVVTPEGKLIIPTIGTLDVDGRALSEVQKMVAKAGAKKYVRSTITAHLIRLRQFRVHVTGQVRNPGPYEALAVDRVSDVIARAGGLTSWAFERGIEVRHSDGTVDQVDLYEYKQLGVLDSNILLRGGDIVYVPSVSLAQATVRVEGKVLDPGVYQLAANESLTDFLLRVKAFNRRADLENAYIERESATDGEAETIPIFPYLQKPANGNSALLLRDGDVLIIPPKQEKVYVIGAVLKPGAYPFVPNLKTRDYVGFAGGTEQAVDLNKVKIIHRGNDRAERGANLSVKPGDTVFVPRRSEFGVIQAFTIIGQLSSIFIALKAVGVIK